MNILSAIRLSSSPATAFAVLGLFWGTFAALVPQLKADIGATDAEFGLLLLGTALGLSTTLILAPLMDRKLGTIALPVAAGLVAVAFLFPGLAPSQFLFFCAMVGAGIASGMTDVLMNARVSEIETHSGKSLMNANHGMFSLAYAFGALGTGLAREAGLSPAMIFATAGVVALMATTQMAGKIEEAEAEAETNSTYPLAIVVMCGGVVVIAFMTESAVESWSALHIERTLDGGAAEGAFGPMTLGLTMAIGRFGGQIISARFSEVPTIALAALLCIAGALGAANATSPAWAYVGFGILGLGVSVIGPMGLALTGKLVPARMRTGAISRVAVIGFMGFFAAPVVMGLISEIAGLRFAFASLSGILILLFPLLLLLKRKL